MSTQQDEINAFLNAQGAKSFAFDNVGDKVAGEIVAMDLRQQTDMQTGEPLTWNDGSPKKALVITLRTSLQDNENDDGQRQVWCRGGNFVAQKGSGTSSLTAVKDAVRKAGAADIEIGARLSMEYTGVGQASNKGFTPPKLYTCEYVPPTANVSLDDLA